MAPEELKELRAQLDAYLKAGQYARSPFGAGVLFARKKDVSLCLCIDFVLTCIEYAFVLTIAMNKITLKYKYIAAH